MSYDSYDTDEHWVLAKRDRIGNELMTRIKSFHGQSDTRYAFSSTPWAKAIQKCWQRAYGSGASNIKSWNYSSLGRVGEGVSTYFNLVGNTAKIWEQDVVGFRLEPWCRSKKPADPALAVLAAAVEQWLVRLADTPGWQTKMALAVRYALVTTEGFLHLRFEPADGVVLPREMGVTELSGAVALDVVGATDVYREADVETFNDSAWIGVIVRHPRYELAAYYGDPQAYEGDPKAEELAEKAINEINMTDASARWDSDIAQFDEFSAYAQEDTRVEVLYWYYKRGVVWPEGRTVRVLPSGYVLHDSALPDAAYGGWPVYRVWDTDAIKSPYAYSPLYEVLGPCDAYNSARQHQMTSMEGTSKSVLTERTGHRMSIDNASPGPFIRVRYTSMDPEDRGPKIEPLEMPQAQNVVPEQIREDIDRLTAMSDIRRGQIQQNMSRVVLDYATRQTANYISPLHKNSRAAWRRVIETTVIMMLSELTPEDRGEVLGYRQTANASPEEQAVVQQLDALDPRYILANLEYGLVGLDQPRFSPPVANVAAGPDVATDLGRPSPGIGRTPEDITPEEQSEQAELEAQREAQLASAGGVG